MRLSGARRGAASNPLQNHSKDSSVTGKDIKNKSLTPDDFSGSVKGDPGPAGPAGPAGPPGAAGAPGRFSTANVTVVNGPSSFMAPGGVGSSSASCPVGAVAIGGGWDGEN